MRYGEVLGTTISSAPLSTGDDDQRSRSKAETQADEDIAAHNNMSLSGSGSGSGSRKRWALVSFQKASEAQHCCDQRKVLAPSDHGRVKFHVRPVNGSGCDDEVRL